MRPALVVVVVVAGALAPARARADWRQFLPRPFDNGVYLDAFGSFEADDQTTEFRSFDWQDSFFRERLTVFSNGYAYHPRFLQYQLSLGGALKQERYESPTYPDLAWTDDSGVEYDARLSFLPEHFYNLDLYARRYEPLFREQAAAQRNSVQTSRGAALRYRKKPYFLNARYGHESITSSEASSDITRFTFDGEYAKRFANGNEVSLNALYNPSTFSNSAGLDGRTDEALLGGAFNLPWLRLSSSLSRSSSDQQSQGGLQQDYEADQLAAYALLVAYLPWSFRTELSYRHQEGDTTTRDARATERTLSDTNEDVQLNVVHRLYQSLDTRYSLLYGSRTSTGGETSGPSQSLSFAYTKIIPHGRLLLGSYVGRSETDSTGQTDVADEAHPATPVPGSFALRSQNVDRGSISVRLRSPLPPFEIVTLSAGLHYTVTPFANTFEITVFSLPPRFVVPGTYDLFASYALVPAEFALRTDTLGGSASLELAGQRVVPFVSYGEVRSDVLSGTFPGNAVDSTAYAAGLRLQAGRLRARGEYQDLRWDVSPTQTWRAELQFTGPLDPTTSVTAMASYVNQHYPKGLSEGFPEPFTDETLSASGSVQKQLFARSLAVAAGGTVSRLRGRTDGTAYSVNASLVWKVGRVIVTGGANAYGSDNEAVTGLSNRRTHEYYYLNVRRTF